jgi:hypothetical protein
MALREVLRGEIDDIVARRNEWVLRSKVVASNPALFPRYLAALTDGERVLAEGIAERLDSDVESDLYPRLLAASTLAAWRTAISRWNAGGGVESLDELLDRVFEILACGFVPEVSLT